jgi:hypothetical protein
MKTVRTSSGPFSERPHFHPREIDAICLEELGKAGCLPNAPGPIRIDRFIEKRFGVVPQYDDLPDGILGYTRFNKRGVDAIVVAKALDTDGGRVAERRIRTTLAHEGGHGLLHTYLFAIEDAGVSIFSSTPKDKDKILCRDVQGENGKQSAYDGRWSEYQANRAIGGLLLPTVLMRLALEPYIVPAGLLGVPILDGKRRGEAERALAEIFDVNPMVVRLRVAELYPLSEGQQML